MFKKLIHILPSIHLIIGQLVGQYTIGKHQMNLILPCSKESMAWDIA